LSYLIKIISSCLLYLLHDNLRLYIISVWTGILIYVR